MPKLVIGVLVPILGSVLVCVGGTALLGGQAVADCAAPTGEAATAPATATISVPANCGRAAGPWTQPVTAPIVSGFRAGGRPNHNGVDLGAARGTPIRAAAAGTVAVVTCNVAPANHGCDRDGSPQIRGCGWYVDIRHPGQVVTRYCHMGSRPRVTEGQAINAGQIIGFVGSSGNSSGPHLHYETHTSVSPGRAATRADAVDPLPFMAARGAPLAAER